LEVECWEHNSYHNPGIAGLPPAAISFSSIQCQIQRGEILSTEPPMWITTTLQRVGFVHTKRRFNVNESFPACNCLYVHIVLRISIALDFFYLRYFPSPHSNTSTYCSGFSAWPAFSLTSNRNPQMHSIYQIRHMHILSK
jgi:hypothetical protein